MDPLKFDLITLTFYRPHPENELYYNAADFQGAGPELEISSV